MAWPTIEHGDFRGGENLADNESVLGQNQAVLLENLLIVGNGQVQKRRGMQQFPGSATFPKRIDHLAYFLKRDGSVYNLVFSDNTLSTCQGTELIDELSAGPYGTEVMQDKFLFVDGESYYESDGTAEGTKEVELPNDTDATLDAVKRCTLLAQHFSRIWATGDPENPNAIYYTQTNRYDYFKGGDEPDMMLGIVTDDAEPAQIFIEMYGGLLLGKRTGWWLLTGDVGNMQARRIIRGMGPVSRAFAIVDGTDLWYIAEDGLRVLSNPDSNVYASALVGQEQAGILFSRGDLSKAVMVYHDQRILVAFKESESSVDNDFVVVCDLRFRGGLLQEGGTAGAGTRITGWPITAFMVRPDSGRLMAGLSGGQIVTLFEGLDDLGEPISWRLKTPRYTAGEAMLRKMYDGVTIHVAIRDASSGFLSHYATIDDNQIINTISFPQGETKQTIAFKPRRIGTYIQHELRSASTGEVSIITLGESVRPLRPIRQGEDMFTR